MIALIFLYLIMPAIQSVLYLVSNFTFDFIETFNYIASITSLIWMLSNVILAAKVPFIQNLVPYDKRIQYHIWFTKGAFALVIYHGIYKFTQGYSIELAIPLGVVLLLFIVGSFMWINKVLKNYDINKRIHVVMQPILGVMIFIHIFSSGIMSEVPLISTILYYLMFISAYGLFALSKTGIFKRVCEVVSIDKKEDIFVIKLKSSKSFNYKSGQFAFLGYRNSEGKAEEHPFSYLTTGGKQKNEAGFGIKILGDFTRSLEEIKTGDKMWIRGGFGNFRPDFKSDKPLNLIGSGIGIVPIVSLVKEIVETGINRPLNVFIAVNVQDEILDKAVLDKVNVHYLVYKEDGLLFSEDYFREKLGDTVGGDYYICSSPGVRTIVVKILKKMGVKRGKIHFENFSF